MDAGVRPPELGSLLRAALLGASVLAAGCGSGGGGSAITQVRIVPAGAALTTRPGVETSLVLGLEVTYTGEATALAENATWSGAADGVASVSDTGTVTASGAAAGTVEVEAAWSGRSGEYQPTRAEWLALGAERRHLLPRPRGLPGPGPPGLEPRWHAARLRGALGPGGLGLHRRRPHAHAVGRGGVRRPAAPPPPGHDRRHRHPQLPELVPGRTSSGCRARTSRSRGSERRGRHAVC